MRRILVCGLFTLFLVAPFGAGSPTEGTFSATVKMNEDVWTTTRTFRAGERAAVIVIGSRDGLANLEVSVFNEAKELVAQDKADGSLAGNIVGTVWYPTADGAYRIEVRHAGAAQFYVAIK